NPGLADELRPWLALLGLEDRLREVTIWCHEQGAAWLEELVLEAEALAEYLELSELQARSERRAESKRRARSAEVSQRKKPNREMKEWSLRKVFRSVLKSGSMCLA
ncbi:unnamed protein product, partial [Effrenium voratum]